MSIVLPPRPGDPTRIGDHRIVGRLGEGGMGVVHLGHTPGGRPVAVKVVRERFARDAEYRARFRREAVLAKAVTGAFTAAVLAVDADAPAPWLATAFLPGPTLRRAVAARGALAPAAVRALAAGLAEALADIHRVGVVHRDLKPANVILTADGPRVIDFGIARAADVTAITHHGTFVGTPGFMAPEQLTAAGASAASDLFALGALVAFAATGREPFGTGDAASKLVRAARGEVDLSGVDDVFVRGLVGACVAPVPGRRPSAREVLDGVSAWGVLRGGGLGGADGRGGGGRGVFDMGGAVAVDAVTVAPSVASTVDGGRRMSRRALIGAGAAGAAGAVGAAAAWLTGAGSWSGIGSDVGSWSGVGSVAGAGAAGVRAVGGAAGWDGSAGAAG
ncbi:hypothetical protein Val02_46580 [Virgisporangium aliadipatigenens]|uniref:Protein kinase domain-containing protein n=1 Tax=Virgisporangium aliadipatigenens TaxID=741659 RepID=A0A8J4DT09_9ACTN|nr:serine/threonine-protein kinase [Virgisporangium aliadipatigenens]GIJ47772.1 hypothetical protein Val02_46580 [Virgisporangium aliadipatigenens]